MFYVVAVVSIILPFVTAASELPVWHNKPLGSHIKPDPVDETFADNLISPADFAEKYVIPRKPIVFRGIVKTWPAYKLWTDEYLKEKYGDMEMRLEGKKEKASMLPQGDICLGRDRMRTFLDGYKKGANKYVVSDLPTPMWGEVHIPPSMSCGDFFTNYVEIDLWMNSDLGKKGNGGNSIIHKDAYNTVNCVLNGTKEWKLIELQYNDYMYQSWEGPMDAGYGGFSIMNPDKINAKRFPDVGKIPRWQFVTINAGDCIHLPSQMWHQVKSFGEDNKAVAFLFSQFNDRKKINTSDCLEKAFAIPLSEVDVDLQYPGTGLMTMGNSEIEAVKEDLPQIIDRKQGYITKRGAYTMVYRGHENGAKNKKLIIEKAKALYNYFLGLAGGEKEKMTVQFLHDLTREQVRPIYKWLFPIEPANSYEHEYSVFTPEEIYDIIERLQASNKNRNIEKDKFIAAYQKMGGSQIFADDLWNRLAGGKDTVQDVSKTIEYAVENYEYHRRNDPELMAAEEDATITTPQGHTSQPKKNSGGYSTMEEDEEEEVIEEGPDDREDDEGEDEPRDQPDTEENDIRDEL